MDASGVRFPGHYLICRLLGIGSGLLAKKTHENDLVQTAVSTAARYIFDNVFGKINEELRLILGNIEKKGYQIQERMLERLFSFLTLVLACIFIILGIDTFLVDYLRLTNFVVYLLLGAALLAAYYLMNKRQRFGNEI
jgi:uncharacterized membrane protein